MFKEKADELRKAGVLNDAIEVSFVRVKSYSSVLVQHFLLPCQQITKAIAVTPTAAFVVQRATLYAIFSHASALNSKNSSRPSQKFSIKFETFLQVFRSGPVQFLRLRLLPSAETEPQFGQVFQAQGKGQQRAQEMVRRLSPYALGIPYHPCFV